MATVNDEKIIEFDVRTDEMLVKAVANDAMCTAEVKQ